jgi:hypothetical chaperone protein
MLRGIGIDFGTTNSVVAVAHGDGSVRALAFPSAAGPTETFRTALTFRLTGPVREQRILHRAGPEALAWALDPQGDQRFIQSIKTHLASRLFKDTRLFGRRYTLPDLIGTFLTHLLEEGALAGPLPAVVAGRPVVFAGENPDEALALQRLGEAYAQAGVAAPRFAYEPLGAAYWYAKDLTRPETVLVADFGGGTSDFSVMRFEPGPQGLGAESLAHDGVGVAGDTFDTRIIERVVAPRLGKDTLHRSLGKALPVPQHFYASLARWHQLSWLKNARTLADLDDIANGADDPAAIQALKTLIEYDLGFELHHAVAGTKAALSGADEAMLSFRHSGITVEGTVRRADFERWISADLAGIEAAMDRALAAAGLPAGAIDAVFMTGGTSYVPAVRALFERRFARERIHFGNAFQSVAAGLALVALREGPLSDSRPASAAAPAAALN